MPEGKEFSIGSCFLLKDWAELCTCFDWFLQTMMEDRRTDEIINKFSSLPCKTDRFHFSVGFFANRSQKTSRCVRKLVTHQVAPHVPLFSSYHILTPSVIYYWTDAINESIRLFIQVNAWDQVVLCIKARGSCIRRMTVIKKSKPTKILRQFK